MKILRTIGWNVLLAIAGLGLLAVAATIWLRVSEPMTLARLTETRAALYPQPLHFVPGVGVILEPDSEVPWYTADGSWIRSRSNSLGFLDREPPPEPRAGIDGCHVAVIGDSMVEAYEVPIPEKLHVRVERLARENLPHLEVTTSAFGRRATGQINQLAFYDEFARHMNPSLVVLVFVDNDFMDNSPVLGALRSGIGWDPDRAAPYVTAIRSEDGTMKLRPPDRNWAPLPRLPSEGEANTATVPLLVEWLRSRNAELSPEADRQLLAWVEFLSRRPHMERLFDGWIPHTDNRTKSTFNESDLPPVFEDALEYTAFALDQFQARAERDGSSLVILATHTLKTIGPGGILFERMNAMAEARDIPVVDQHEYIVRQGNEVEEAFWPGLDGHWTSAGHRWAAEALIEYLESNQEVCDK